MRIDVADGPTPSECCVTVEVGGFLYNVGETKRAWLHEEVLAFATGLREGRPFTAEFGCEPLFNVEFIGVSFLASRWHPRFRTEWLGWLGSTKVTSKAEKVDAALDTLKACAASLEPT